MTGMGTNTDTIENCPAHLTAALAAARLRWTQKYVGDHRATQAAEVLEYASLCLSNRSWGAAGNLGHALLGAWLAETAFAEEDARIAAAAAAKATAAIGPLSAAEIAMVLAARQAAQ